MVNDTIRMYEKLLSGNLVASKSTITDGCNNSLSLSTLVSLLRAEHLSPSLRSLQVVDPGL